MRLGAGSTILSRTLLIAATPLFLLVAWLVVVVWPSEVVRGLASIMSGRDVIQVADGKETGVTLLLAILALGFLAWILRLRPPERLVVMIAVYGAIAVLPAITLLGMGTEYGLQAILSARGYEYCTFHVTDTGKGQDGTYVYVRRSIPEGCAAVQAVFPPNQLVADRREPFDLPR